MIPNPVTPYLQYAFLAIMAGLVTTLIITGHVGSDIAVPILTTIMGIAAPSPSQSVAAKPAQPPAS